MSDIKSRYVEVVTQWAHALLDADNKKANRLYPKTRELAKALAVTAVDMASVRALLDSMEPEGDDHLLGVALEFLQRYPALVGPILSKLSVDARHGHTRSSASIVLKLWRKGTLVLD